MEMKHLKKHIRDLAALPETDEPVASCYAALERGSLKNPQAFHRGLGVLKKNLTRADRQHVEEALSRHEHRKRTSNDAKGQEENQVHPA